MPIRRAEGHVGLPRDFRVALRGVLLAALLLGAGACARPNYLYDFASLAADKTMTVVVENPAGSEEKWEVRADGRLLQEFSGGQSIRLAGRPWPVNGGMIPRTLLSYALGGDGEPLDVLLLGDPASRGSVVRAVAIGTLEIIDHLERDDKILAVPADSSLRDVTSPEELESALPGVKDALIHWYTHSRSKTAFEVLGFRGRAAALLLIQEAAIEFEDAAEAGEMPEWVTP